MNSEGFLGSPADRRTGSANGGRALVSPFPRSSRPHDLAAFRSHGIAVFLWSAIMCAAASTATGQAYCPPDRDAPGDEMIQRWLYRKADELHSRFLVGADDAAGWQRLGDRYRREYLYMLGLDPMPAKSPLKATVTGTLKRDGYVVDKLHYQSRPGLYVTGNLYRPDEPPAGRMPAVFYVCGHSYCGRNGNKTAYQSHGIWLARHGYVCLTVDSLQLGEIASVHHGTYREGRWWWHARGYTPAGVECLNGLRGIDYLVGRDDVDPERIGVTGISGGGAATFWIAAADPRVKVAVPVSGMADLPSYVGNRVINGHCDCMFLYNTFQWPWTRIAGLVAPRALLFTNSDGDKIFPMDANRRVIERLKRLYKLLGAGEKVDAFVSHGGHAYREDIRKAALRWINSQLTGDDSDVTDSEVDLVVRGGKDEHYPIDPEDLRVFPTDDDVPADALNAEIDRHFVPVADVAAPGPDTFEEWRADLLAELRRVTFGPFPKRVPAAKAVEGESERLETDEGIRVGVSGLGGQADGAKRVLLVVSTAADMDPGDWLAGQRRDGDAVVVVSPRGCGPTRWTVKSPPNTVRRSHVLLGWTQEAGRVWDVAAVARYAKARRGGAEVVVTGSGAAGVLGAYAALIEPDIAGAVVHDPPATHMADGAPALLNVLRVCDIPDALGMLAPRPLILRTADAELTRRVRAIYTAAGAAEAVTAVGD